MVSARKEKFLILVRGLGGTGKTTISTALAKRLGAPVLNRDDVKQAIQDFKFDLRMQSDIGYQVMHKLAEVQLDNGVSVILDANARFRSMQSIYESMASKAAADICVVNCFCSSEEEWRQRITARGNQHPLSFQETKEMSIDQFDLSNQLQIDTSSMTVEAAVEKVIAFLKSGF